MNISPPLSVWYRFFLSPPNSFTGGDTGISISKKAGMVPLQMELGGKDACIVLEDADIDLAAANIVKGGFSYRYGMEWYGNDAGLSVWQKAAQHVQFSYEPSAVTNAWVAIRANNVQSTLEVKPRSIVFQQLKV